jgi:hypothetical protein
MQKNKLTQSCDAQFRQKFEIFNGVKSFGPERIRVLAIKNDLSKITSGK